MEDLCKNLVTKRYAWSDQQENELFRKLHKTLCKPFWLIIYESFIRPYLDYADITHGKAYNASSYHHNLDKVQYKLMLPITGAMQKDFQRNITLRFGIRISQKKKIVSETLLFL